MKWSDFDDLPEYDGDDRPGPVSEFVAAALLVAAIAIITGVFARAAGLMP